MSQLSPKQTAAIAALLANGSVLAASKAVDISYRQIWRWLDDPTFAAELKRQQDDLSTGAFRKLQGILTGAVDVIAAIMGDTSIAPGIRLRAADSVLSHSLRWAEHTELSERMAAVEAAIAQDMLMAAVAENSDPVQPARRVIDYRLKLKPPPGYTDGDDQSAP